MRHLGVLSAFTTGRQGLGHVGGEGGVPEDLLGDLAWAGTGPASPKVMPVASLGAYFFIQSTYLVSA